MNITAALLKGAGILAVGMVIGLSLQPLVSEDDMMGQMKKFNKFFNLVQRNYIEDVELSSLMEKSIVGMLGSLDPHSVYIPPSDKKKNDETFRGNFGGIGIQFRIIRDTITVIVPIIGGPSEKEGIQCNDKIVSIDGESAIGIAQDDVPQKLKGPDGTEVVLGIQRAGETQTRTIRVKRGPVPIPSVDGAFLVDNTAIGYVYVNRFAATTHREVLVAVRHLVNNGATGVILDLRWNGGGYLEQAYRIADEFVSGGKKIVYRRGRFSQFDEDYYSTDGGEFEWLPVAVLINASSASASEIVAGAIQDLDRGLIIGETSFGKGLVQQQYDLGDGSAFRLTTSRYFTPSGRLIQRDYSDKAKYYALEGRATLDEGENLDHIAEEDSTRPVFTTISGRTVYGGGGIVPDYVVKNDTVSSFRRTLIRNNVFGEFVEGYILEHGNALREKCNRDMVAFMRDFTVTPAMLRDFRTIAEKKDIAWNEGTMAADSAGVCLSIKALVADYIFNTGDTFVEAVIRTKQVEKAVALLPEAAKLAKLKMSE